MQGITREIHYSFIKTSENKKKENLFSLFLRIIKDSSVLLEICNTIQLIYIIKDWITGLKIQVIRNIAAFLASHIKDL